MDLKRLGQELRTRRVALGRTLAEVGDHAGCTRQNVYKVEKALSNPTVNTLDRIADGLDLDLDLVLLPRGDENGVARRSAVLRSVVSVLESGDKHMVAQLEAMLDELLAPPQASTG